MQRFIHLAIVGTVLFAGVSAEAQVGYGGFSYGRGSWFGSSYPLGAASMPLTYGGPRMGYGYGGAGYGGGPRSITWYTPGLGYSSSVQTGLPWMGAPDAMPARNIPSSSYMLPGTMIARQERAARRLDTLYAMKLEALERKRMLLQGDPEVMPASAHGIDSSEVGKGTLKKEKQVAAKKRKPARLTEEQRLALANLPMKTIPVEGSSVLEPVSAKENEAGSTNVEPPSDMCR